VERARPPDGRPATVRDETGRIAVPPSDPVHLPAVVEALTGARRNADALATLPEPERVAWRVLWPEADRRLLKSGKSP
jgi:hypothetical protein